MRKVLGSNPNSSSIFSEKVFAYFEEDFLLFRSRNISPGAKYEFVCFVDDQIEGKSRYLKQDFRRHHRFRLPWNLMVGRRHCHRIVE